MMSSDTIRVSLPYRVLIPSVVATAIIFVFVLIVITALCMKKLSMTCPIIWFQYVQKYSSAVCMVHHV